jgi:hypothetical protein
MPAPTIDPTTIPVRAKSDSFSTGLSVISDPRFRPYAGTHGAGLAIPHKKNAVPSWPQSVHSLPVLAPSIAPCVGIQSPITEL